MSLAALSAIASSLWPPLRKRAMKLGRWAITELAKFGIDEFKKGTRKKIRKLQRKLKRFRKKMPQLTSLRKIYRLALRMKWIEKRIARRLRFLRWLDEKASQLSSTVTKKLGDMLDDAVPQKAPEEIFNKWRGTREGKEEQQKLQKKIGEGVDPEAERD